MKEKSKIILGVTSVFVFLLYFIFSLSCATANLTDDVKSNYPLLDHQEVIYSQKDRSALFTEARSYLIDILSNAEFISSGTPDGDMLSTHIREIVPFGAGASGTLEYAVIIEIKDKKMRFTTKNVQIITYNGYGQMFVDSHDHMTVGNLTLRKKCSERYRNVISMISKGLNDIAAGKSSSDW